MATREIIVKASQAIRDALDIAIKLAKSIEDEEGVSITQNGLNVLAKGLGALIHLGAPLDHDILVAYIGLRGIVREFNYDNRAAHGRDVLTIPPIQYQDPDTHAVTTYTIPEPAIGAAGVPTITLDDGSHYLNLNLKALIAKARGLVQVKAKDEVIQPELDNVLKELAIFRHEGINPEPGVIEEVRALQRDVQVYNARYGHHLRIGPVIEYDDPDTHAATRYTVESTLVELAAHVTGAAREGGRGGSGGSSDSLEDAGTPPRTKFVVAGAAAAAKNDTGGEYYQAAAGPKATAAGAAARHDDEGCCAWLMRLIGGRGDGHAHGGAGYEGYELHLPDGATHLAGVTYTGGSGIGDVL
jgi:hypothetical protein